MSDADVPGTDSSSATPTSEGTSETQGAESIAVSAAECEESKGILKITTDASKDNISCDATERETPEVCAVDVTEQASAVTSNTDNSDAAPCEIDGNSPTLNLCHFIFQKAHNPKQNSQSKTKLTILYSLGSTLKKHLTQQW